MDVASDILIGTGPFAYISQSSETTVLEAYDDYYLLRPSLIPSFSSYMAMPPQRTKLSFPEI
jgi:MarR-like DNA-binding transcriptional regulator SgrR of sgrS sRNA